MTIVEETTIKDGKKFLRENWDEGAECPCCAQLVKLYKRKINARMCYGLVLLYKISGSEIENYIHVPTEFTKRKINHSNIELSKLQYWGLVTPRENTDKSKKDSGYWSVTQKGKDFIDKKISIPKYALIYNSRQWGFSDELVSINDALGTNFDFQELMNSEI